MHSIRNGKIVAASRAVIGRIGLGAAVKAGAPKPDITTVDRFKAALLATKGVAYPGEGASGRYFASLVERMGIGEQMKPKMRPMAAEDTVEVVARGEADMVVVVASRIVGVPGVEFVGLIPAEVQANIGFATGISSATKSPTRRGRWCVSSPPPPPSRCCARPASSRPSRVLSVPPPRNSRARPRTSEALRARSWTSPIIGGELAERIGAAGLRPRYTRSGTASRVRWARS